MKKTEIHNKDIKYVSKKYILLYVIGFLLLGAISELIFGIDKADEVIEILLIVLIIIAWYINTHWHIKIKN